MKKDEFVLKVLNTSDLEWGEELEGEGFSISISAWDNSLNFMIDQHITEAFPEILDIHSIEELAEGDMAYAGDLTKDELKDELARKGFAVV